MFEIIAVVVAVAAVIAVWLRNRARPKDTNVIPNGDRRNLYQMTKPELLDLARNLGLETRGMVNLTKELIIMQIREKRGY